MVDSCVQEDARLHIIWRDMMHRCYNEKCLTKFPSYTGCSVCDEWHVFASFKEWAKKQNYEGNHLDKDILIVGNKVYSPSTCVFVDRKVNLFLTENKRVKGVYPTGVDFSKISGKFRARCWNNDGTRKHIGLFTTPEEAHLAWKAYKHSLACKLAEDQSDIRVAEALRRRYL